MQRDMEKLSLKNVGDRSLKMQCDMYDLSQGGQHDMRNLTL